MWAGTRRTIYTYGLLLAVLGGIPTVSYAQSTSLEIQESVSPFASNYLSVELARNYPFSETQRDLEPGHHHPAIGFTHLIASDWLSGVHAQFKVFDRRKVGESGYRQLAFFTLKQGIFRTIRVQHPVYMFVGPQLLYLLPARKATIPVVREPEIETEIGAGLTVGFLRMLDKGNFLSLRIDRWRGTRTTRFQAVEFSLGYHMRIGGSREAH